MRRGKEICRGARKNSAGLRRALYPHASDTQWGPLRLRHGSDPSHRPEIPALFVSDALRGRTSIERFEDVYYAVVLFLSAGYSAEEFDVDRMVYPQDVWGYCFATFIFRTPSGALMVEWQAAFPEMIAASEAENHLLYER